MEMVLREFLKEIKQRYIREIKQRYIRRYGHCRCNCFDSFITCKRKYRHKTRSFRYHLWEINICDRCGRKYKKRLFSNLNEFQLKIKLRDLRLD